MLLQFHNMRYIKAALTSDLFNVINAIIPNGNPRMQHGEMGTIARMDPAIQI